MESNLIAGRYKPLFPRARGGFSTVEVAWDSRLARRVAIKRISTGNSLPVASLEEARTVALLSSPNIVNVYDFEQTGTETLIIMENVDGPSLAELMADSPELLSIEVATTILDGIVAALEYAHENQVLHLDIKPANVLIEQSGHIKVSDFGLAELAGVNGFGEVQGGTIGYMPPEQLTGGMVDARSDIWALAALSYQLLTGVNPFFALSPRDSLQLITDGAYAIPSELRPGLAGAVDEALIRALSPEMNQRQPTVTEFWLELRPHLGKIGAGRRKLKSLAHAWSGKEAALLDGTDTLQYASASDYRDDTTEEVLVQPLVDEPSDTALSGIQGTDEYWLQADEIRRQRREERRAAKHEERAARGNLPPIWQRLSPAVRTFIGRLICALGAASMAWFALSALPYLSDPLAQAATAAAVSTGTATPALLDAAFTVRLVVMLLVALVAFIVPSVGSALAAICLILGFYFTGNWLIGTTVLIACVVWWICIGRRSPADSAVFTLSPLLTVAGLPMLLPVLAGYFQSWKHALGTAAISGLVCALLSILTYHATDDIFATFFGSGNTALYGEFGTLPLQDLLGGLPTLLQMPNSNQLFIPFITLFTSIEFWCVYVSWLGTSVVMSLLMSGKSRVKYIVATLCGTGILAAGYLLPLVFFASVDDVTLLAAVLTRLVIALALCLLFLALGVQPKPYESQK